MLKKEDSTTSLVMRHLKAEPEELEDSISAAWILVIFSVALVTFLVIFLAEVEEAVLAITMVLCVGLI